MRRGNSWPNAASFSRLSWSVLGSPVVSVFFCTGSFISSKRISRSCLGEPMLNGRPAAAWMSASIATRSASICTLIAASTGRFSRTPWNSISASTSISGISSVLYSDTMPVVTNSGSSNAVSRQATSASSQAYVETCATGTWSIVSWFLPLPISSLIEMFSCFKYRRASSSRPCDRSPACRR